MPLPFIPCCAALPPDLDFSNTLLGPTPFQFRHSHIFFGREENLNELVNRVLYTETPLIIVNGLSGVGKTSLLRAGLLPRLQAHNYTVVYSSILDSPESEVIRSIQRLHINHETVMYQDIPDAVNTVICPLERPFVLIVDQVERCFTLTHSNEQRLKFWRSIAHLIQGDATCVTKVILTVRSDWLYAFQEVSPAPVNLSVFNFLFRLEPLTVNQAKQALTGPLDLYQIAYESALIDTIVKDLTYDGVHVNPTQLQIVGDALYTHMKQAKDELDQQFSLQDYTQLHGARSIIRKHLFRIVENLGPSAQLCWQILLQLAGPEGLRVSKSASELSSNIAPEQFESIVQHLVSNALLVREISTINSEPVYTLTHDYLVEEINQYVVENLELQAWRTAEHYLDNGLTDWRYSLSNSDTEVLIDQSRYEHIWSQYEVFKSLTAEAHNFLTRTALFHGQSNFSYWLDQLSKDNQPLAYEILFTYIFHDKIKVRQNAQTAVIDAIRENKLENAHRSKLKDSLWLTFKTGVLSASDSAKNDTGHELVSKTLWKPAKIELAQLLWALRLELDIRELSQVFPIVTINWINLHRTQIIQLLFTLFTVFLLLGSAWFINEYQKGYWHSPQILYAGPIAAFTFSPAEPGALYVMTPRGPDVEDGVTLLLQRNSMNEDWEIISKNITHFPVAGLAIAHTIPTPTFYLSVVGRGILSSTDGGRNWREVNSGLSSFSIGSFVIHPHDPTILYAGANDKRGVFKSTDGGNSWVDISGDELFGISVYAMTYTPFGNGQLIVGTEDGRIFSRGDEDENWHFEATYPGAGTVITIAMEPLLGKEIYAGTSNGNLLYSPDAGSSWWLLTRPYGLFSINSLSVSPGQPQVVFMNGFGIGGYTTWVSKDGGESWQLIVDNRFTREGLALGVDPTDSNRLIAAGSAGLFTTINRGETWHHHMLQASIATLNHIAISPIPNDPIYVAVGGSIYVTDRSLSGTWRRSQTLPALFVEDIVPDPLTPGTAYAATYLPNQWSIAKTIDSGNTWTTTASLVDISEKYFDHTTSLEIVSANGVQVLYAGSNGCGVIHSTDQGTTWNAFQRKNCVLDESEPRNIIDLSVSAMSTDKIYAAADHTHIYFSENRGRDWHVSELPITGEIVQLETDPQSANTVYLIAGTEGFWRSDDNAQSWQSYSSLFTEKRLSQLAVDPNNSKTLFVASHDGDLWRSTNAGLNWTKIRENPLVDNISTFAFEPNTSEFLMGTSDSGIFRFVQRGFFINQEALFR